MCVQHGNTKNVPTTSMKPEQNWVTAVLRTKEEEKKGVSNGIKPRTQIFDKTPKKE
jgi:hypothetical protein